MKKKTNQRYSAVMRSLSAQAYKYVISLMTVFLVLVSNTEVSACGICGCAGGFTGLGYMPESGMHFVGARYIGNFSSTLHPILFEGDAEVRSSDYFHRAELWGRYAYKDRMGISLTLPYQFNISNESEHRTFIHGMADPMIAVDYVAFKTPDYSPRYVKHKLGVAAGVQVPLGPNDFTIEDDLWTPTLQPGKGAFALWTQIDYSMLVGNGGFYTDVSAMFYGVNKHDYKYADQYSANLMTFYNFLIKEWRIAPEIGLTSSVKEKDILSVEHKMKNMLSGGWQMDGVAGVSIYTQNTIWRLKVQQTVAYDLSDGYVSPGNTATVQFLYIIQPKSKNNEQYEIDF